MRAYVVDCVEVARVVRACAPDAAVVVLPRRIVAFEKAPDPTSQIRVPRFVTAPDAAQAVADASASISQAQSVLVVGYGGERLHRFAWEVAQCLGLNNVMLAAAVACDPDAVRQALFAPLPVDESLVLSCILREVAEDAAGFRRLGSNLAELAVLHAVSSSAGAMSSDALGVTATLTLGGSLVTARWDYHKDLCLDDGDPAVPSDFGERVPARAASVREFIVTAITHRPVVLPPPPPYRTATLCEELLAVGAVDSADLDLLSALEARLISEGGSWADSAGTSIPEQIFGWTMRAGPDRSSLSASRKRQWKLVESSRGSPFGIFHPSVRDSASPVSDSLEHFCNRISARAAVSQLQDAKIVESKVDLQSNDHAKLGIKAPLTYTFNVYTVVEQGWLVAAPSDAVLEMSRRGFNAPVANVGIGDVIVASKVSARTSATSATGAFGVSGLVRQIEAQGWLSPIAIGRAVIALVSKGKLSIVHREAALTADGRALLEACAQAVVGNNIGAFLATVSRAVAAVASRSAAYSPAMALILENVNTSSPLQPFDDDGNGMDDEEQQAVVKCPRCGGDMARKTGNFRTFWGCSGYPRCRQRATEIDGKLRFSR